MLRYEFHILRRMSSSSITFQEFKMPSLIIEQPDKRSGGQITGRVLIGRLPTNGILVPESNVSRLHAWIDTDTDAHHYVADGGSLTGTWVNGRAIEKRRLLGDGDVIRIGTTQLVYSLEDHLPEGIDQVDLAGLPPDDNVTESGVLFDCPCGAPVWFKAAAIGQIHVCRQCGNSILIPGIPSATAEIVSSQSIAEPGVPPGQSTPIDTYSDLLQRSPIPMPHPTDEYGLAEMASDASPESVNRDGSQLQTPEPFVTEETKAPIEESTERKSLFQNWRPGPVPELAPLTPTKEVAIAERAVIADGTGDSIVDSPLVDASDVTAVQVVEAICSICHSTISDEEQTSVCPSCGLTFHADCWHENFGCSAYGCPQVNALQPPASEVENSTETAMTGDSGVLSSATEDESEAAGFPWEFIFMAISVVGSLLGALAYGIPALIGAIGTGVYLAFYQDSRQRRIVAIIALLVCILGTAGGIYASYLWWNGWPPVGPWARRKGQP